MKVQNWVSEQAAIAALNVVPPMPGEYVQFLQKFSGSAKTSAPSALMEWQDRTSQTVRSPHEGFLGNYLARPIQPAPPPNTSRQGWQLPSAISRKESLRFGEALTSAHLRLLVDEWLHTGQHADGSEAHGKRTLHRARVAHEALWEYIGKAPVTLQPSQDPSGFSLAIAEPTAYTGEVTNFFDAQAIEAKRLFTGIMASDWKDRLCKCRYGRCGLYFMHPRPRKSYQHGTFCTCEHARIVAAEAAMRRMRGQGLTALIEAAARKLHVWKVRDSSWQGDLRLKSKLAGHLCEILLQKRLPGYHQAVHSNWVTRHKSRIERVRIKLATAQM